MQKKSNSKQGKTDGFNYCLYLLGISAKSVSVLRLKLQQKGYSEQETEQIIDKLTRLNLIDDQRLAIQLVDYYKRTSPVGALRLKQILLSKGIPGDIAIRASKLNEDEETELIKRLLDKKGQKKRSFAQLGHYLQSRGFSGQAIRRRLSQEFNSLDYWGDDC